MVKRHWHGILRWFQTKLANGIMEAVDSLAQADKAKARGYRSIRNPKSIIYLIAGRQARTRFTHISQRRAFILYALLLQICIDDSVCFGKSSNRSEPHSAIDAAIEKQGL